MSWPCWEPLESRNAAFFSCTALRAPCLSHQSHQKPCNYVFQYVPILFLCSQTLAKYRFQEKRKETVSVVGPLTFLSAQMKREIQQELLSGRVFELFWTFLFAVRYTAFCQRIGSRMWLDLYTHSSGGKSTVQNTHCWCQRRLRELMQRKSSTKKIWIEAEGSLEPRSYRT